MKVEPRYTPTGDREEPEGPRFPALSSQSR